MSGKAASCQIRPAKASDGDALFELAEQFAISFRPQRDAFETCLRELASDPAAWLSVADCGGKIAGYCLGFDHFAFFANGRVAWIEELMVGDAWRRQRIGACLVAAFEEWSRSRGVALVALATRRAAAFYTSLGYEESATYFRKLL
jgi:GNAT superfamily N-acetyltransferase